MVKGRNFFGEKTVDECVFLEFNSHTRQISRKVEIVKMSKILRKLRLQLNTLQGCTKRSCKNVNYLQYRRMSWQRSKFNDGNQGIFQTKKISNLGVHYLRKEKNCGTRTRRC